VVTNSYSRMLYSQAGFYTGWLRPLLLFFGERDRICRGRTIRSGIPLYRLFSCWALSGWWFPRFLSHLSSRYAGYWSFSPVCRSITIGLSDARN